MLTTFVREKKCDGKPKKHAKKKKKQQRAAEARFVTHKDVAEGIIHFNTFYTLFCVSIHCKVSDLSLHSTNVCHHFLTCFCTALCWLSVLPKHAAFYILYNIRRVDSLFALLTENTTGIGGLKSQFYDYTNRRDIIFVFMIQPTLDVKNRTLLKQVMSHNVNTEAHSRNHCCREKHYKYYIFRARVYSLSYPASKAHAPYYIATCNLPKSIILFRIFS